jgi:four helix bundle suffix protein
MSEPSFIPHHGGHRQLRSYQKAEVIYDLTFRFCERFLERGDRTKDQMVQAARSGKQNIAEGCQASGTSKEMEIKLVGVARASLEELLTDYVDFLRVRDLRQWEKDSPEALLVRQMGREKEQGFEQYRPILAEKPAEIWANTAVCLVHQANYLLDQQLRSLEEEFLEKGGMRERMAKARNEVRWKTSQS